eukprot:1014293-Pleurochrysis_carterae.AAC.2
MLDPPRCCTPEAREGARVPPPKSARDCLLAEADARQDLRLSHATATVKCSHITHTLHILPLLTHAGTDRLHTAYIYAMRRFVLAVQQLREQTGENRSCARMT